jgi:hypothetical protein
MQNLRLKKCSAFPEEAELHAYRVFAGVWIFRLNVFISLSAALMAAQPARSFRPPVT